MSILSKLSGLNRRSRNPGSGSAETPEVDESSPQRAEARPSPLTESEASQITRERMALLWMGEGQLDALLGAAALGVNDVFVDDFQAGGTKRLVVTTEDVEWAKSVFKVATRADAAARQRDFPVAIDLYEQALTLAPGADIYLMSIGCSYGNMGLPEKGVPYLQHAHRISPASERITNNLRAMEEVLHKDHHVDSSRRDSAALEFAMEPRKTMSQLAAEGRTKLRTCAACNELTSFPIDTPPCGIAIICEHCGAPLMRVNPESDHVRPELVRAALGYQNRCLLNAACPWCGKRNNAITAPANCSSGGYADREPQNPHAIFRMQVDCVHCNEEFWMEWD